MAVNKSAKPKKSTPEPKKKAPVDVPKAEPEKKKERPLSFKIESPETRPWLNAMFYSDYGVGKTELLGTAAEVPRMKDVLLLDTESGRMTIDWRIKENQIDVIQINDYKTFARVHEWLRLHCRHRDDNNTEKLIHWEARLKGVSEDSIKKPRKYRTLLVDSLTEVQKYCMYSLLGIEVGSQRLDIEPDNPTDEWYSAQEMMRLMIRSFRNLPMHVIFACARGEKDDKQKNRIFQPLLPGKLAHEAQGFLDVVGFMVAEERNDKEGNKQLIRRTFFQPGPVWSAKDRFHKRNKIRYIDDITLAKFIKADENDPDIKWS